MLKFAFKNMLIKKAQILLMIVSIVVSAGVAVLCYNTAQQVNDGITSGAGYYSAIIGPAGSKTQLAMNTMYFTDSPLGTIPYALVSELSCDSRVTQVIPFAMADSYNGYNVVGTTVAFLDGKSLQSGEMFSDAGSLTTVVGYNVAKTCSLSVGDVIYTSHAAGEEHKTPITVCGILKETHSAYDNQLFTQIGTLWAVHEEEEEEETEHEHEEMNNMVCAVLVKTANPAYAMTLVNDYNGKVWQLSDGGGSASSTLPAHVMPSEETEEKEEEEHHYEESGESWSLQAIEPMDAVRGVLEDADSTRYIVFILCGIILVMNIVIICVITLLNMYHSAQEISLMRLIGISMKKINLLYLMENGIAGLISVFLAFAVSRACLGLMSGYVAGMGVVLNHSIIYPLEIGILLAVFLITLFPTAVCTALMSRKDGLAK